MTVLIGNQLITDAARGGEVIRQLLATAGVSCDLVIRLPGDDYHKLADYVAAYAPPLVDKLEIGGIRFEPADCWRRAKPDPDIHTVETADELSEWLRSARSPAVIYFRGDMSRYRHDAALRIAHLQQLQDQSRRSSPRPATEGLEIDTLQKQLELCDLAARMGLAGSAHLSQKPQNDGNGWVYIATRHTRRDQ